MRICVAGGAGFIGSHVAQRLKSEGHYIIVADITRNKYFEESDFCSEFHQVDLRFLDNCLQVTKDVEWVFNFAADMGGMGFIQSNNGVILYNNIMISFNMAEASRRNNVKRFFYASSACVYPNHKQLDPENPGLKEDDAWPADPQDAYGLEKIVTEKLCIHYSEDFNLQVRIARFHNIYGPRGTWKGGREKAPAAFCRKAIASKDEFEIWGDGQQTRSFCYIDDCVEAVLRLMRSDFGQPINIGSEYMVSMTELGHLALKVVKKDLPIRYVKGPQGVRGRNSDNTLIRKVLSWEPVISLEEGMRRTAEWIAIQIELEPKDSNVVDYSKSQIVNISSPDESFKTI